MNYEEIISLYGTPTYIFSIDELNSRVEYLRKILNNNVSFCYAMKANPFLVGHLPDAISRIEVCSAGEYEICKKNNIPDCQLVISGVNKQKEQIEDVITLYKDEIITVESMQQFLMIKEIATEKTKMVNLLIRLTSGNQFGVSESELYEIISMSFDEEFINILGIEYFSGTQKHSLTKISREFEYLKEVIKNIKEKYDFKIEELEFGPGFPIYYFESDFFNEEEFLSGFNLLLTNFKEVKITLEIGRSIASSCGLYLTKVVDIKKNSTGNYAILDGGIHHLVYYGASLAMKTPYHEIVPKKNNRQFEKWMICGSLCSVNDVLIKNIEVDSLAIGDTFIFKNTGAYSVTEGISLFLSRDLPKILIKKNNQIQVIRDKVKTYPLNMKCEENIWKD